MKKSSHIRSYVRREHRMTPGQARALTQWRSHYILSGPDQWLEQEVEYILEIGFGMGQSLLAMAAQFPHKYFIGIEVHRPGIGALLAVAARKQINNIRIYHDDAINVLKQYIKDESLTKTQIFFPDPWPKNRHQKRRLIQADFVRLLQQKLKPGGELHLATDSQDYANHMLMVLEQAPGLTNYAGKKQFLPHRNGRAITKFEQRALQTGGAIYDLLFINRSKYPSYSIEC